MAFARLAVAALIAGLALGQQAQAQARGNTATPAEFPPASYKSTQYVDSRGCVYIRAGVDGSVTWVPRMTRSRTHVCNMAPSKVAGASAARPSSPKVEQITLNVPATPVATGTRVQPAAAPAPQRVAQAAPVPRPAPKAVQRRVAARTIAAPAAQPAPIVIRSQPVTAPRSVAAPVAKITPVRNEAAPAVKVARAQPACRGASPISQQYINSGKDLPVRCGPQPTGMQSRPVQDRAPAVATRVPAVASGTPVASTNYPGSTRVVPLHVARTRANAGAFLVPEGFRAAWDDDRLNPHRADGTLAGRDSMNLFWTNTVPRRLIDRTTGRDVTAKRALVYPFTDRDLQMRALGDVTIMTRNGQTVKRIVRNPGAPSAKSLAQAPAQPKTVYSTRSAPAPAATAVSPTRAKPKAATKGETLAGKRYVQVGTFADANNAQATSARLKRQGLPMRIGKYTRNGKTYRMVLAGPFADGSSAQKALRVVRGAGFGDAFLRK